MANNKILLDKLEEIDKYIKAHPKKFINKYQTKIKTFKQAKEEKQVGITCLIPLSWALYDMGIPRQYGKSGSFSHCYKGKAKDKLSRITKGQPVGMTLQNAVDKKLLKPGDILTFNDLTHTATYTGTGYVVYEGGGACVQKDGHYAKGIKADYSKHYKTRKISEILRWKDGDTKLTSQEVFIQKIAPAATADYNKSNILASITMAQAILESAWGTSDLAKKANALFGIKKHDWKGKTYTKKSYEYEHGKKVLRTSIFRAYNSWKESINDHSNYLRTRKVDGKNFTYKAVVGEKDYKKAAKALQKAGYSTYPNYAKMLIDLIEKYSLEKYDKKTAETKVEPKKSEAKPATPKTETAKKTSRIFLDAGHGGKDPGATKGKRTEKADVLKLVLDIGKELKAKGYTVGYSRTSDIYETPTKKAEDSNAFKADYFFSFHRNCYNGKAKGYENLYYSHSTFKDKVMDGINGKMKAIGFSMRGDKKRTDLTVLKRTKAPALLFEVGFIDNTDDNKIFDSKYKEIVKAFVEVISANCK